MAAESSNRWLAESEGRSRTYDQRWEAMEAAGHNVHGEADFVQSLAPRSVLDAGCGTGRVAAELARRGIEVVGVDVDPSMLEVARRSPGVRWYDADLAELDLPERFDVVVAAGNVVVFLAEGTEQEVLRRLAAHLVPGGLLVSGWRTDRLPRARYDAWVQAAGLEEVTRSATWDGDAWHDDAAWCVAVDRRPG